METKIVLSGIRATGKMHLGNFLGAIQNFVRLAQDPAKKCYYFIANLHTLTTHTDPKILKQDLDGIIIDFLASGLDCEKATIYTQSSVPEISELNWLLACLTPVADVMVMPHFKEKKEKLQEMGISANVGLLTYPVLMAADILGPRAHIVPVGEDQHPHVELARDLAKRFNSLYGIFFPIPELLSGEAIRVPGLNRNGKMAKSDTGGTILLSDPPEIVAAKFKIAPTDPKRKRRNDPGDPEVCNIFTFHHLLSAPKEIAWVNNGCRTAAIGCIECKEVVTQHVNDILAPIREQRKYLEEKENISILIKDILHEGGIRARKRICETVEYVKDTMGVPLY